MNNFKNIVSKEISSIIGLNVQEVYNNLSVPPTKDLGDFAFPCFLLSKKLKKSPQLIALEYKDKIQSKYIDRVEAVGAYINIFLNRQELASVILKDIMCQKDKYGSSVLDTPKTITIDFSATNIAKPFHIGHIRSTVIGDVLRNVLSFIGYKVVAINYLGDWGTQFGMLISAYKRWGNKEVIEKDPIHELLKLYVKFNAEAAKDEEYKKEARSNFNKLEKLDKDCLELWQWFRDISLKEFKRVYDILNIDFDSYNGEYYHSQFVPKLIELLKEKNLLVESEGCMVVELEDDMPPAIILKSDGSSTYLARDLATAYYRKENYDFYKNIYVVASQQTLHFKQLKSVLKKMNSGFSDDCEHVNFGMVSLEDGTLSTRNGKVVFLEDVLNSAVVKTREIIDERNPDLDNKEQVAKAVGIGAVKFQEIYNTRQKDYVFKYKDMLNFNGETGPYVQYAYARCSSILRKSDFCEDECINVKFESLVSEQEKELIISLSEFPDKVMETANKYMPSILARHLVKIAQNFNRFYGEIPVNNETNDEIRKARLSLVAATRIVIGIGLKLANIEALDKM